MKKRIIAFMTAVALLIPINVNAEEQKACYLDESVVEYAHELQDEFNISAALICATIQLESSGNKNATNGICKGLMQVSEIHNTEHLDLYNPQVNMRMGTQLIAHLANRYQDPYIVMAHYHGESKVEYRSDTEDWESFRYSQRVLDLAYEIEQEWQ